jgi:hypothetical protein
LTYRVGTHATFFETMQARLSTLCLGSEEECREGSGLMPLSKLTTRDKDDPSIALLDAWAIVADVLTFYQERIANEGYLRTAIERNSIIELARLVGYRLRPGVAASVYLALTVEDKEKVVIEPFDVRAQSVPGPGELPQSFENIEKIEVRGQWNKLVPRLTQPQNSKKLAQAAKEPAKLYLKGITTGLNQGDPLLITIDESPFLFRIMEVTTDAAADRTKLTIGPWFVPRTKPVANVATLNALVGAFQEPGAARPHLDALSAELEAGRSEAEMADVIESKTLPDLERLMARKNISNALRERVRVLHEDLSGAVEPLRQSALAPAKALGAAGKSEEDKLQRSVIDGLVKQASVPPRNTLRLERDVASTFQQNSDLGIQTLGAFQPTLLASLPDALGNTSAKRPNLIEVYAFRVKASPFGSNAPLRSTVTETINTNGSTTRNSSINFSEWTAENVAEAEDFFDPSGATNRDLLTDVIYLDGSFDKILSGSWVVVDTEAIDNSLTSRLKPVRIDPSLLIAKAARTAGISRAAYGMSGKSTKLEIGSLTGKREDAAWMKLLGISEPKNKVDDFQLIRRTVVYAQAELLPLTEAPIEEDICTTEENQGWIVLDGVYSELNSGRWVIVEGERADVLDGFGKKVAGVKGTELAMLADVVHEFSGDIPGDTAHTRIKFAADLEYCYARDKVTIYANVVKATHGETRKEILGSGDGSKPLQQFALKQPPLTYVSAPTPSGVESTLKLFVNDVEWHEAESIFGLQSTDRRFVTSRSEAEVTTAIFGNGKQGSRLPTGSENIRSQYRQGIGKGGNVAEGKITMLAARPLSVKEVNNPRRASGGADPETRDQARKNVPLAVLALDRLVSTIDYADFARTFGGVGKAFAVRLSDGIREIVHVTIAGAADIPIEDDSDLMRNLRQALTQFGDPALPVTVATRELLLLIISAGVKLLPDYVWEKVAPQIRTKMFDKFSFEARELGQDVFLSEVISTIQSVQGVAYVDVNVLGGIAERNADGSVRTPNELIEAAQLIIKKNTLDQRIRVNLPELPKIATDQIRPAQLAYLVPEVRDSLILNLIE